MRRFLSAGEDRELFYMDLALQEAAKAAAEGEIPVGAVVVHQGGVVGRGHNRREKLQDPTAHAEILALREAAEHLQSWRLQGCTLYVTMEPCIMCVGGLLQARISRLVFGCLDSKGGAVESLYRLCEDPRLNHRLVVQRGILEEECSKILTAFFPRLRKEEARGVQQSAESYQQRSHQHSAGKGGGGS